MTNYLHSYGQLYTYIFVLGMNVCFPSPKRVMNAYTLCCTHIICISFSRQRPRRHGAVKFQNRIYLRNSCRLFCIVALILEYYIISIYI